MASFSNYFGVLFFSLLLQITYQTTISTTSGVTSVVATSTNESMTSVQGSISPTSTQALVFTEISTSESMRSVQGSISSTSTQALVSTATSATESMRSVQGSISPTSTQALVSTATSATESMRTVQGSISPASTQALVSTATSATESMQPVQGSISPTSTQALVFTAISTSESMQPVQGSLSSTSTQALVSTATSAGESMTSVQGSLSATSTQAPLFTSTIYPVTTGLPYSKPVIVQGLKDINVREGMKLVMKCKATGQPQPYFIWQKGNIELKNTSRILIQPDNSLTILNTTRHDAGQYECIARNTAGLESASTAEVKVNYISDVNITMDKTSPLHEGTDIKLKCSVHSHPRVFFTWAKNGEEVDGYKVQITEKNGFYVGVLHRRQIKREMGGNYTCVAKNYEVGVTITASKLLHVHLANKPTYPPLEEIETTAHTITVPIHNIKYLGNGKKVRQIQVIIQQLEDDTLPPRQPSSYSPGELGPYSRKTTLPYIAAVLHMDEYKNHFILGDDRVYSEGNGDNKVQYHNVPLSPEKYYTAFQRLVSEGNDHESLAWIQPIKTARETNTNTSTSKLGLILGLLFAVLVIAVVAIVLWKYLNRKKPISTNNSTDALEMYPERELFEPPERPRRPVHF